jgi:hypothetical protein
MRSLQCHSNMAFSVCVSILVAAAAAPSPPPQPCVGNMTGTWKDPRHPQMFTAAEAADGSLTVDMSSAGFPSKIPGRVFPTNGTLYLVFSPTHTSTGQLESTTSRGQHSSNRSSDGVSSGDVIASDTCDFLEWTDGPDRLAGNVWCRVGASGCSTPPAPPHPSPSPPSPAVPDYPLVSDGSFSGVPVRLSLPTPFF